MDRHEILSGTGLNNPGQSFYSAFNLLPNDKFLESSKLKEFAEDNSKFDENYIKFLKREENTAVKG